MPSKFCFFKSCYVIERDSGDSLPLEKRVKIEIPDNAEDITDPKVPDVSGDVKPLPDLPEDSDVDQDPSESDDEERVKRAKADALDALVKVLDQKQGESEESSDEIQIVEPPSRPKRNRQPVKRYGH